MKKHPFSDLKKLKKYTIKNIDDYNIQLSHNDNKEGYSVVKCSKDGEFYIFKKIFNTGECWGYLMMPTHIFDIVKDIREKEEKGEYCFTYLIRPFEFYESIYNKNSLDNNIYELEA